MTIAHPEARGFGAHLVRLGDGRYRTIVKFPAAAGLGQMTTLP